MLPRPHMSRWGEKLLLFAFLLLMYVIMCVGIWWIGTNTPEHPPVEVPEGGKPTLEKYLVPEKDRPI